MLRFNKDGSVDRRFTPEWAAFGIIRIEKIPELVASIVSNRTDMVNYIAELHNCIDELKKYISQLEAPTQE